MQHLENSNLSKLEKEALIYEYDKSVKRLIQLVNTGNMKEIIAQADAVQAAIDKATQAGAIKL